MTAKKEENKNNWLIPLLIIVVILIIGFLIIKNISKEKVANSPDANVLESPFISEEEMSLCEKQCDIVTNAGTSEYDLCVNTCTGA